LLLVVILAVRVDVPLIRIVVGDALRVNTSQGSKVTPDAAIILAGELLVPHQLLIPVIAPPLAPFRSAALAPVVEVLLAMRLLVRVAVPELL
jgi:hypothetical protein